MGKHDELLKTLEARLVSAGVTATTGGTRETIRVEVASADAEMARLQSLRAGTESGLDIERPLGEGGMGLVLLATQRSLDRKVAVKTVREKSIDAIVRLVREAKITGGLEHPNVVPVHDLSVGPDGIPRLVLKRVEGTTWTERMRDEAGVREQFGAKDLLEWNVQTLMQVCQAIHFANSRGIVHRDLKPDNVMVGSFGEVYVVDWGIAVRASEKHDAQHADLSAVGTPVYMAPEMLVGEVVDARTDVYLLGGLLFEILSGRAPHDHTDMRALIQSVLDSPPPIAEGPEELVSLARACLARDPAARPESAEAVRRALANFLRHRDSAALAARATAKAEELDAALRREESSTAQRLYGECVFGFRAALEAWPENAHGRAGLVRVVRTMTESDLDNRAPETAALRLLDLPERDAGLEERVQKGLRSAAERAQHVEVLKRMEVELDPATGQRIRLRVSAGLCLIWVASDLVDQGIIRGSPLESLSFFFGQAVFHFLVVTGVIVGYWRYFKHSMLNRQLAAMVAFCMAMQMAAYAGAWFAGYSLTSVQAALLFVWFTVMGMLSVTIVRAVWPSALGFLAGFFVAAAFPHTRHIVGAVTNLFLLGNVIVVWRTRKDPTREEQRDTWTG